MIRNCDIIKMLCKARGISVLEIDKSFNLNGYLAYSVTKNVITPKVVECLGKVLGEDLSYLINSTGYSKINGQN